SQFRGGIIAGLIRMGSVHSNARSPHCGTVTIGPLMVGPLGNHHAVTSVTTSAATMTAANALRIRGVKPELDSIRVMPQSIGNAMNSAKAGKTDTAWRA